MLENLRKNFYNPLALLGGGLFIICCMFNPGSSSSLYLTVAQLLFVPVVLQCVVRLKRSEKIVIALGMIGVMCSTIGPGGLFSILCAGMYVLSTVTIAWMGCKRFLHRGFTNIAEITIDVALVYLLIGGLWFFAFVADIDTGFTPMITWLTAIHFHYSGFLLNMSVGLFGRICHSKWYPPVAIIIMSGLLLVAVGITFSRIIEMMSVLVYIVAIYSLFVLTLRTQLPRIQAFSLYLSIAALCVTILWSLLYAVGNLTAIYIVTIPDMLSFHGWINCVIFGGLTMFTWAIQTPETSHLTYKFPVSKIRGKLQATEKINIGLVDELSEFCETTNLPNSIIHFYEQTNQFTLYVRVKWYPWFKPFAFIYKGFSRLIKQINLPLARKRIEMTGDIVAVDALLDGRNNPRAWIRKLEGETVFTAIYSKHTSDKTYLNIALPLPFSTMTAVLYLFENKGKLHLTSNASGDTGTYLAIKNTIFKLPLHEYFVIEETTPLTLKAVHKMSIFGVRFLRIDYDIFGETDSKAYNQHNEKELLNV